MVVTSKLKERFCRDCNIPLRLYKEPYFEDRIKLYDKVYGTVSKWNKFLEELQKYKCEQDYLEEYNRVKDNAINDIKGTEAYQRFNNEDMNQYRIKNVNMPGKDIFKPTNDKRRFISIDIIKANFSSLKYYDASIFGNAETWEEFISRYTNNEHIIKSKYVRQVVLGNCNPKRHITYEKFIMDEIMTALLSSVVTEKDVVFFSNDEIVIDITNNSDNELDSKIKEVIQKNCQKVAVRVEKFTLHSIGGTNGYYKEMDNGELELKGLDNYIMPFALRKLQGEEVTDNDLVFYHEGLLAKFLEAPEITI